MSKGGHGELRSERYLEPDAGELISQGKDFECCFKGWEAPGGFCTML